MYRLRIGLLAALVAVAVSSLGASAANAAEGTFVVSAGSASFTGTQTGAGNTLTLTGGRVFSCATSTISGTVANGATSVEYAEDNTECTVKVGGTTLIATENGTGCVYRQYHFTQITPHTWSSTTALICPPGATGRHITFYSSAANHAAGIPLCIDTIPPFSGIPGPHLTRNTNGTVTIAISEVSVAMERTFGTIANCGEAKFNGKLNGSDLVTPSVGTLDMD